MNKFLKIVGAVAVINIVARVFGFLREMAIGYQYGASPTADGIFTAYMIPNFLYLVVGGAFTTALISVYNRKTTDQGLFVKQTFTIVTLTLVAMTAVTLIFTEPILEMFKMEGEAYELTKHLFYWMMPSSILLGLASWYSGLLNIHDRFHLSSFAILIYNAAFVVIAVVLSFFIGPIAYGISAFASAVVMLYYLAKGYRKLNSHPIGVSFARTQSTRDLWIMVLPVMIGGGTIQIYSVLQRFFVGVLGLGDSAISVVNYASRLTQFPQAILITAVTTVIYPILSKKEAENDHESIRSLYGRGMHYLLLLLVPVSLFAYFYAENIVQVIFEYSNFTAATTAITAPVVAIFVISMFFLAANTFITRFYYAKGDSMTPVIMSLINVFVVNIAAMYVLADSVGVAAIAWGTVISSITNTIMLVLYAHVKYDLKLGVGALKVEIVKPIIPFIALGFILYFSSEYLVFDYKWLTFIVGLAVFGLSSVILFTLFKVTEVRVFYMRLKNKLLKTKV